MGRKKEKRMKLHFNRENAMAVNEAADKEYSRAVALMNELREDKEAFTGWVNRPMQMPEGEMEEMLSVAEKIRSKCEVLIVVGIGGSYLGTAAILDALGGSKAGCPEIVYAGNNMSGNYHAQVGDIVKDKEVCLCVVSKSGGTMESRIAFSIIKGLMEEKYGKDETAARIVAITDPVKGILREEVNERGYTSFVIPGNIGGRYSAFTAGIMFPLAVAGVDIVKLVEGAREIAEDHKFWDEEGIWYALTRYALNQQGKDIEVFEYYDPSFRLIGEWCKQLFGESEGKEGKGLFPVSLTLTADLHSMGQYLQEGKQIFFETIINVKNPERDLIVPETAGEGLAGRSLNDINQLARQGVIAAHTKAGIQVVQLDIEDNSEYCIGQLLYFLMMTAGVTGKLMGIDPFNQPGVEDYKAEIRALLGR